MLYPSRHRQARSISGLYSAILWVQCNQSRQRGLCRRSFPC